MATVPDFARYLYYQRMGREDPWVFFCMASGSIFQRDSAGYPARVARTFFLRDWVMGEDVSPALQGTGAVRRVPNYRGISNITSDFKS